MYQRYKRAKLRKAWFIDFGVSALKKIYVKFLYFKYK